MQAQLDAFRLAYDEQRPHRAIGRVTPGEAYRSSPKAHPAGRGSPGHFRLRYDLVDRGGRITLRRAGRLHHLGVGAAHARRRVLAIVDEREVTVVALDTGEALSTHRIEPESSPTVSTASAAVGIAGAPPAAHAIASLFVDSVAGEYSGRPCDAQVQPRRPWRGLYVTCSASAVGPLVHTLPPDVASTLAKRPSGLFHPTPAPFRNAGSTW